MSGETSNLPPLWRYPGYSNPDAATYIWERGVVLDHKDIVHDPSLLREPKYLWTKTPREEGCWGISHRKSDRLDHNQCMFRAEGGHLTCKIHRHLEDRARMLKRARNDERLT